MAVVGELLVLLAGNNTALTASLLKAEAQMKAFSASATTHAGGASNALLGVGIAGAAVAAGAALVAGASIKAAADFEESMAIINTIAHQTPEELNRTGLAIRGLAKESGAGLPDLTGAFYDLLSVGVPTANAMDVLRNSVTLSIGGISTTTEAANAITTAINSWGVATGRAHLTMSDATKVTDIFAKTIEQGGLKANEIAPALAQVSALAAAMNIPLEEVGATWAVMTTRGFTAATAATAMNSALVALQRIPPGMQHLQDVTGKSYETIASTQGAQAAMQALVTDAAKYGVNLIDVFGRQEALGYALNVTGAAAPGYQSALNNMYNSTGTAAGQAAERSGTFDRQMKILGGTINDIGITIGTALLPVLQKAMDFILPIVNTVAKWINDNPELSANILLVAGGIGVLAVAAALLLPLIGGIVFLLGLVSAPVLLIVAAIALLALAWSNNWLGIRDIVSEVAGVIGTAIGGILAVVDFVTTKIGEFFGWLTGKTGAAAAELGGLAPGTVVTRPNAVRPSTPYVSPYVTPTGGTPTSGLFSGNTSTTVGGVPVAGMFQHGGVVPGLGAQLVVAHGGETIIPPGGGGQQTVVVNKTIRLEVDGRTLAEIVDRELFGSASGFSSGFASNNPVTGA